MATSLENLFKKRTFQKKNFTLNYNKLLPIIQQTGAEACESLQDAKDLMVKVEGCFQSFVKSHDNYVEALESDTAEKDADEVLETQFKYQNEVEDKFMSIRKLYNKFVKTTTEEEASTSALFEKKKKAKESISELKLNVLEAIDLYTADKTSAECIKQKVAEKSMEDLAASVETVHIGAEAVIVRSALGESSKKLIAALTPFKNAVNMAELDWNQESADLAVKCSAQLSQEVSDYRAVLSKVISAKERIPPVVPSPVMSPATSQLASACPVKLAKVENIEFSGEYRDFSGFKRNFETIVVPNRAPSDIGLRLRQALPSKYLHLVDNFEPSQYKEMMEVLKSKFGNPRHIVSSCLRDIDKLKTPQTDELFITFVEDLEKIERDLKAVNLQDRLYHETVLTKLEHLLPEKVKGDWSEYACQNDLITDEVSIENVFKGFMTFLSKYKKRVDWQISQNEVLPSTARSKFCLVTGKTLKVNIKEAQIKNETKSSNMNPCLACNKDGATNTEVTKHPMAECDVWNSLSFNEKNQLVGCIKHPFSKTHNTNDCQKDIRPCQICQKTNHHFLLCSKKSTKSSKASCKSSSSTAEVLLKTMIIDGKNASQSLGVIEDNCSTDNYITYDKANELKLKGLSITLEIEGINTTKVIDSKIYQVPIRDKKKNLHIIECYGLEEIAKDSPTPDMESYTKLCNTFGVDVTEVRRPRKIDLLLSAKSNHLMSDKVLHVIGGVKLYEGPLGRTFFGTPDAVCNMEHVKSYPTRATPIVSSVKRASVIRSLTDKEILKYFKEESIGAECNPKCGSCECGKCPLGSRLISLKEEREYQKFRKNMFLDTQGTPEDPGPYWRTKYPWNIPKEELINNYEAVLGVMNSTVRKLDKDPSWRVIYEEQLHDLTHNGFSREISESELSQWVQGGNKIYYIAHQMVVNPANTSTPIRTVFNSSQVYRGYSLNSSWDLGPDMTNSLHGILLRFRENLVGAQGDIRKMYYGVRVTKDEEFMQLYIWRFKGEQKIRVFAMTRLVMGNKPSANCSQIALKETAFLDNSDVKYPYVAKALVHNSYVDNTFTTAEDLFSLKENISNIEKVAAKGGFVYKPWVISGENVADLVLAAPFEKLVMDNEKALGVYWDVRNDKFFIKVEAQGRKHNSTISLLQFVENPKLKLRLRDCLSLHARAFDPLGLILPLKMLGNLLFRVTLQQLSDRIKKNDSDIKPKPQNRLPWDEEVFGVLRENWTKYFSMLEAIKDVKFRRSIKPPNVDPCTKPAIVTFSDGNENAYGAVAYALWTLSDGSKEAHLIMSKAKLGPLLQKGEIVKNELSGATYAVRIKTWILQNTDLQYGSFHPFVDSRIVQDMIKKESYLLNTFAGLRVKEINSKSDTTSWMHISSKDNFVSDILTKGATPDKLIEGSEWQTGPKWLVDDPSCWPVTIVKLDSQERDIVKKFEKVAKCLKTKVVSSDQDHVLDAVISRSNSLNKVVRISAYMLRLVGRRDFKVCKNFHQKDLHIRYNSNPITAAEFDDALKILIQHEQITKLDDKKYIGLDLENKKFTLSTGRVIELITVKSRVKNFPYTFSNQDNSVFAMPASTFAKSVALFYHNKFHKDVDTVVAHIRKEFWIPQLRKIVSMIDKHCKFCLIIRQKVSSQFMGDLPLHRSVPSKPFLSVSMDLFGPLMIKDSVVKRGSRVKKKVWGVLFVCTTTRAVYIDIAEDYSSESVLHCVRRLMADRGEVQLIISDPGTQLKGASSDLKEYREGWNEDELVRFGASHCLDWQFTMPSSPHQNGVTEIMVKLVKGVMSALTEAIGTTVLFLNELFTVVKEVSNIVNERPIGLKPNLQTDPNFLSPNSLLLGRCSDRISSGPFQRKEIYLSSPKSDKTRFLLVQRIASQFWKVWTSTYFPTLLRRQKWHYKERNVQVGDICVLKDSNALRGEWRLCIVEEVYPDENKVVRNVAVKTPPPSLLDGSREYKKGMAMNTLKRHVSNLIVIVPNHADGHGGEC